MLTLKGKVLTLKGKQEQTKEEQAKAQAEIDALRRKGVK
jgi:hypothetical protein